MKHQKYTNRFLSQQIQPPKFTFYLFPKLQRHTELASYKAVTTTQQRQILIKVGHSSTELGTGGKITQSTCGLSNHII